MDSNRSGDDGGLSEGPPDAAVDDRGPGKRASHAVCAWMAIAECSRSWASGSIVMERLDRGYTLGKGGSIYGGRCCGESIVDMHDIGPLRSNHGPNATFRVGRPDRGCCQSNISE